MAITRTALEVAGVRREVAQAQRPRVSDPAREARRVGRDAYYDQRSSTETTATLTALPPPSPPSPPVAVPPSPPSATLVTSISAP